MLYLNNYIEKYGNLSFSEKPFNEVDNLIFTQLVYNNFDGIIEHGKNLLLKDAAKLFFDKYSDEDIEKLLTVSQNAAKLLLKCSLSKRFGYLIVYNYVNNIDDSIDKQVCAASFKLDDGSLVVSFRGTDATVTGLKESCMLSYMFPIPAQIEALHYFQETAMLHDGRVRVCGHSKGGNLAVFAAVNCSNSLKRKIEGIYACDAPGFPKWFFERYDYRQIEERLYLYTPQSSVVGRLLAHEKKPEIIQSNALKTKQHSVISWVVEDDRLVRTNEYDDYSNNLSEYFNSFIEIVGEDDLVAFYDTLEYIAESMGVEDFYALKEVKIKELWGIIDTMGSLDHEQKEKFKFIFKKLFADFAKEYVSEKAKGMLKFFKRNE